jgi:hypothetical protein
MFPQFPTTVPTIIPQLPISDYVDPNMKIFGLEDTIRRQQWELAVCREENAMLRHNMQMSSVRLAQQDEYIRWLQGQNVLAPPPSNFSPSPKVERAKLFDRDPSTFTVRGAKADDEGIMWT